MFHDLVSHNPDLKALLNEGYALRFVDNYLVVRDIPYVDAAKAVHRDGTIVSKIDQPAPLQINQVDHQIFWCGSHPYQSDGNKIGLGGGPHTLAMPGDPSIKVEFQFSNKPIGPNGPTGFPDFFEKIESYVRLIAGPAMQLDPSADYRTFRVDETVIKDSIFKFNDTLTSRAEIGDLAEKLRSEVVAIIGLGGTGSYVLDFMVKSPVKEIRAFDGDKYHIHNAYRSPGRLQDSELGKTKAEVCQGRYENFRHGLTIHPIYIDSSSEAHFEGVTFAFVCVDKGRSRREIFDLLLSKRIPFIDVGMGLDRKRVALGGRIRTTYYSAEDGRKVHAENHADLADDAEDIYLTHVQIAELNALNAALAVMRYKQTRGFYFSRSSYHFLLEMETLTLHSHREGQQV